MSQRDGDPNAGQHHLEFLVSGYGFKEYSIGLNFCDLKNIHYY